MDKFAKWSSQLANMVPLSNFDIEYYDPKVQCMSYDHYVVSDFQPYGSFILNTDTSAFGGRHWVAVVHANKHVFYYDPLAMPPDNKHWKRGGVWEYIEEERHYDIIVNREYRSQSDGSDIICGYCALMFMGLFNDNVRLATDYTPELFDKLIREIGTTDPIVNRGRDRLRLMSFAINKWGDL